ncbi:EF-hand domain-containing protein [Sphingomonas qilianensis]
MIKYVVMASAVMLAAPVLAQTQATAPVTASAPAQTAAATATGDTAAAPATAEQITQVVNSEFPTYDKDGDGRLSSAEFGAWMVALKSAGDPTAKADNPATRTWVGQAFASADADKNKSVSKTELTGFLTQAG